MAEFRVVSIAVASGKIGFVMLSNDKLANWEISQVASETPKQAEVKAREWIELHKPEVVVTEAQGSNRHKHGKTLALMKAVENAARKSDAINVRIAKVRDHKNKYHEARALAQQFPELKPRLAQKPACWLNEPRRMILFEALALALRLKQTR